MGEESNDMEKLLKEIREIKEHMQKQEESIVQRLKCIILYCISVFFFSFSFCYYMNNLSKR